MEPCDPRWSSALNLNRFGTCHRVMILPTYLYNSSTARFPFCLSYVTTSVPQPPSQTKLATTAQHACHLSRRPRLLRRCLCCTRNTRRPRRCRRRSFRVRKDQLDAGRLFAHVHSKSNSHLLATKLHAADANRSSLLNSQRLSSSNSSTAGTAGGSHHMR